MESERHNTHILSFISFEEQNKTDKINTELKLSVQNDSENNDIIPIQKIKIKDIFKNFDKRADNQIIQLDGNEESDINEEAIKYWKSLNKKNNKKKNISDYLKNWIDRRKQMQEINTENFEFIENKIENKNINNDEATQTENRIKNENQDNANLENGANSSNEDTDQIGNPSNRTNTKNNKDIINTNRENRIKEELDDRSNKETNEGNKETNLNENNEKSLNMNDSNYLGKDNLKKQNKKYNESNFNFYLLNNQYENKENENSRDLKNLMNKKIDSEINNNFNSSEDEDYLKEDESDYIKTKGKKINIKKRIKNNKLVKNNNKNKTNYIKKNQNLIKSKSKSLIKEKSKSNSKNIHSFYSSNNNNYRRPKIKENDLSQIEKSKNLTVTEKNNTIKNNSKLNRKNLNNNKKGISKFKNANNKLKTSGDISAKNKINSNLINFATPKNNNRKIKREIIIPIPRKCLFTKTVIQMDSEQFNLLNEKIRIMKEKNMRFHQQKKEYNPILNNNNYFGRNDLYDDMNNMKFIGLDSDNNNQDFYSNNISKYNVNNQRNNMNHKALNNYMNKRIISPSILINRHLTSINNKKMYQKKLTDIPLSPYLINKYNLYHKPLNKSNSAINLFNIHNKNIRNKFPNINNNHNSLKPQNHNKFSHNNPNDINLNFFKSNTIFNFNPKNNVIIPIIKGGNSEEIKSANAQKFQNSNFKSFGISTPVSADMPNKINLDMKYLQNAKKLFHAGDKGYGKHFGNEKECPICQSMLLKSNYNMKNISNYNEFIKQRDQHTIKFNKEQFLHELKKPSTQKEKMEATIMKEIKQFINYSKKAENMYNNYNYQNDSSIINAYFG